MVSAPSGTGKTTLVEKLVELVPDLVRSCSYTSRPRRPGELDGIHYNFVDPQRFTRMVEAGDFLEWATIYGHRYGTSAIETERHRQAGKDVVLVIDVQGGAQVRQRGADMVGVFVLPPSYGVLEHRLRARGAPAVGQDDLQRRLETARREIEAREGYDYIIVNDDLERCLDRLRCIVLAHRSRTKHMAGPAAEIAATFDDPADSRSATG